MHWILGTGGAILVVGVVVILIAGWLSNKTNWP